MVDTGWPAAGWEGIVARVCAQRLEPPRVEDTTYEGYRVRKFSFEFIIKKGGESS